MLGIKRSIAYLAAAAVVALGLVLAAQEVGGESVYRRSGDVHPQVRLFSPRPGQDVASPLQVSGAARGTWYFEGDFPIRLYDSAGREFALAIATAQEPWMTEDFVPFEAELVFAAPADACLVMVLEKDNPSDLREFDDEVRVGLRCPLEK